MSVNHLIVKGNFPAGTIYLNFDIQDSAYADTIYPYLVTMSGWEIGLQNDNNDLFQYPNGFTIDFMTNLSPDRFFAFAIELQIKKITVNVIKNEENIFTGYVYNSEKSMTIDYRKQIISIKIVDQIVDFKTIDPRTNPFGYTLTNIVLINDLILDLLSRATSNNSITEIINLCPYEVMIDGGSTYYPVSYWGVYYAAYFATTVIYENLLDVIKSLLNTLGCKGFIGFDNKFYIVPFKYSSDMTVKTIPEANTSAEIKIDIIRRMYGLQILVHNGITGAYTEYDMGVVEKVSGNIKYPDLVGTIKVDQPVSALLLGGAYSGLFLKIGGSWYGTAQDFVRRKKADGTYTIPGSLWYLTANDLWNMFQVDRPLIKMKVYPTNDSNGYSKLLSYLTIQDFFLRSSLPDRIMHARWLNYNWSDNLIEVEALQDTSAGSDTGTSGTVYADPVSAEKQSLIIAFPFRYDNDVPLIYRIKEGEIIIGIDILLLTAFENIDTPSLRIFDEDGDLFLTNENDLLIAGNYSKNYYKKYSLDEDINLEILGSSTQGTGTIFINIIR